MASRYSMDMSGGDWSPSESRRSSGSSAHGQDSYSRQQRLPRSTHGDPWPSQQGVSYVRTAGPDTFDYSPNTYTIPSPHSLRGPSPWPYPSTLSPQGYSSAPTRPNNGPQQVQVHNYSPPSSGGLASPRSRTSNGPGGWPGPLLRRISSEDTSLHHMGQDYYNDDLSASVPSLPSKGFTQRRASNRDEFDGPAQFLNKPSDGGFEPREEEMPTLPISLHSHEQDEILARVNDILSKCAFDFVAKYQFPIPIEPDKRPVRVPSDREWQEWCFLLKRLATKRRIPARVLYNGQIKQLITILENSLEMRHAAKHQSRPLKDDRNILQLISSGLQVAKILKDAPAMQVLDALYVQTERTIQGRGMMLSSPNSFGGVSRV